MLQRVIILPSLLSSVRAADDSSVSLQTATETPNADGQLKEKCHKIIGLLRRAAQDSLFIVPKANFHGSLLSASLEHWPQDQRKAVETILAWLKQSKRLIETDAAFQCEQCASQSCPAVLMLKECKSREEWRRPKIVFGSTKCCDLANTNVPGFKYCDPHKLLNYVLSGDRGFECLKVPRLRIQVGFDQSMSLMIPPSKWSARDFENYILRPVFGDAKRVKIFDRYVGRTTQDKKNYGAVSTGFATGISWLLKTFAESTSQDSRRFEVWTGLVVGFNDAGNLDLTGIETALDAMLTFLSKLKVSYPRIEIEFHAFLERRNVGELPHARFLVTDQTALFVDRGFDLLHEDVASHELFVKDTLLSVVGSADASQLENVCFTMPQIFWNSKSSRCEFSIGGRPQQPLNRSGDFARRFIKELGFRKGTYVQTLNDGLIQP